MYILIKDTVPLGCAVLAAADFTNSSMAFRTSSLFTRKVESSTFWIESGDGV
jgi:hypothetical protein